MLSTGMTFAMSSMPARIYAGVEETFFGRCSVSSGFFMSC